MLGLLQNIFIDRFSFFIGVITGALGLWLFTKSLPTLSILWKEVRTKSKGSRTSSTSNHEELHRHDTLRYVQRLHLASSLFALDEILVEPQLMFPPTLFDREAEGSHLDIQDQTIPYMPDWPEIYSRYKNKSLSLADALSGNANLILMGYPGSGKTVALAHLICQIVRRDQGVEAFKDLLPIFVHVSDLLPENRFEAGVLEHVMMAVRTYANSLPLTRHQELIQEALNKGRAILLVDGMDEVPHSIHKEVNDFLDEIIKSYPRTRIVINATPENISGLTTKGLIPISMAAWNERQYFKFMSKWGKHWSRFIEPSGNDFGNRIDPRLLNAWFLAARPVLTPFEATMKVWAAFAGDSQGPDFVDAIESYVLRFTKQIPDLRPSLEDFALQMIASQNIALDLKRARGLKIDTLSDPPMPDNDTETTERTSGFKRPVSIKQLPGSIPSLLASGVLVDHNPDRFSFSHPLITAYFAAAGLANAPISHFLSNQEDWSGKYLTLSFLVNSRDMSPEVADLLDSTNDPLLRDPLKIGRWLSYSSKSSTWRTETMRLLADQIQQTDLPIGLRMRLISALLLSKDEGVRVLLEQISYTSNKDLRRVAALGLGYLLDINSVNRLGELLEDPEPSTYRSACLALSKIGGKKAIELLGTALLNGHEDLQHAVCESLSLNPTEGHEILKDASQIEDLMVRRSSVFGLVKIQKPWALEILERLAVEDKEWVVRTAATQALEEMRKPDRHIPTPKPPLHESLWLITYADKRGLGVAPGKPAQDLLIAALDDGSKEIQLAALDYLKLKPVREALPYLDEFFEGGNEELVEAAYETLWYYAAAGLEFRTSQPLPVTYH